MHQKGRKFDQKSHKDVENEKIVQFQKIDQKSQKSVEKEAKITKKKFVTSIFTQFLMIFFQMFGQFFT